MATSFVTLVNGRPGKEPGFWMRDEMLELWLRLLSLHLPEPDDLGEHAATPEIRNRWLLASRGYFTGCVPHDMRFACSSADGQIVVRKAINSLLDALQRNDSPLDAETLNLLGMEDVWVCSVERRFVIDIAYAFLDLLDNRIECTAHSTDVMPGSKPYARAIAQP